MTKPAGQTTKRAWKTLAAALTALAFCAAGEAGAMPGGQSGGMEKPAGPQIDPAQSYQEGVEALQNGDYERAENKLDEVLSVASGHPEANYYMGLARVGRGKAKSAIKYFKKAVKSYADFVEAREQLALAYIATEKPEKAQEELAALQEIRARCSGGSCDGDLAARADRAIANVNAALSGAGDAMSAAPGAARHALLSGPSPDEGEARYGAAVRLINQERYEEAIAVLYDAQRLYGPHPDILNYLGFSHRKMGAFEAAKAYYAQALALDPDHLGATEYLGELYLELGDVKAAREQLAKLERLCVFGCAEREALARLIDIKESARSASR